MRVAGFGRRGVFPRLWVRGFGVGVVGVSIDVTDVPVCVCESLGVAANILGARIGKVVASIRSPPESITIIAAKVLESSKVSILYILRAR